MTKTSAASYRYTRQGLNLKVISQGVSKTHVREFLRTLPAKHMRRLNTIYFVGHIPPDLPRHNWDSQNPHENFDAIYIRHPNGEMNIGLYISQNFLSKVNKNRMWLHMIRRVLLHEIGHHLTDITGNNFLFAEREMEDFVDRYTERRSNMRVLMLKPNSVIQKYDKHWIEIERLVEQ